MPKPTWKAVETQIARFFGAERNPLSGQNSRHTKSDSLHKFLYIETKYGKKIPKFFNKTWQEAKANAELENKTPIVCLKNKGQKGFFILVHSDDFNKILTEKELIN